MYVGRGLWNTIWSANVSPKVKIFTWKLATNSLAVQENRSKRIPNVSPICSICGMEEATRYHATMSCTHAKAVKQGLYHIWEFSNDSEPSFTRNEWVLVLLDKLSKDTRYKMMFIWWRAWHHKNNIIFGDGKVSIQK
jgi:hypothetical protein